MQVLSSPTTKDFSNIMLFLVRHIDPNLLKSFGKLEEEVPQLYKRLKYPFAISKSNLAAVGSPHTWPTILAALCWTVELLIYSARAESCRIDSSDDRTRAEIEFFQYVSTSYHHFMAGEDHLCEEVDNRKASQFDERAIEVRAAAEKLSASNESLKNEIASIKNSPSPLLAAQKNLQETQKDKEKFLQLLDNLHAHKASLQRKVTERQTDVAAQQRELADVETENEQLRATIATQKVHPADVIRMNQDKSKHESALRMLSQQRESAESKAAQAETSLESKLDELESILGEYHACADRLQIIPLSAKRAEGVGFEIILDRNAGASGISGVMGISGAGATNGGAGGLINVDLKGIVKPALQRMKDRYASKARELAQELLSLEEKKDAATEVLTERREESSHAEAHVKALEAQYRQGKEALEVRVAAALAQVEGIAAEVTTLRGACVAGVVESEERLKGLQGDYEELQRAVELENVTLHRDLAAALEAVLNHKMAIQSKLKGCVDRVGRVLDDVGAIALPHA